VDNNKRVIIVDFDPQCNSTDFLFRKHNLIKFNITDYFDSQLCNNYEMSTINDRENETDILTALQLTQRNIQANYKELIKDKFYIINGNIRLDDYTNDVSKEFSQKGENIFIIAIKELIDNLRRNFDYVILDLSPSLNSINKILLTYSDIIIPVLNYDSFSKISLNIIINFMENDDYLSKYKNKRRIIGCSCVKMHNVPLYFSELPKDDNGDLQIYNQLTEIIRILEERMKDNIQ